MFRALFPLLLSIVPWSMAKSSDVAAPSPAATLPPAVVFLAHDPLSIDGLAEDRVLTGRMVDRLVLASTGRDNLVDAWRSLIQPADRVGIKVCTAGGRFFSSHRGIVDAIVAGLVQAGIPSEQVIVWDRNAADLRAAGFIQQKSGYRVRSIEPVVGYDPDAQLTEPVLGKLIWGDLLFRKRQRKALRERSPESEQLSPVSHLATLVSRDVTKIINVPVFSDEANCGVAGALYNMTIPNIDNWRRFIQAEASAADSIPSLYADERIAPKVVLHIMDGLSAQYAGGPHGDLNYAFPHATIYASKDPVALDATALRQLEIWRKLAKLPPINRRADWLRTAEEEGLGVFAEERIAVHPVPSRQ